MAEETERIKQYQEQKEAEAAGRQTKRAEESAAKEHVQSEFIRVCLKKVRLNRTKPLFVVILFLISCPLVPLVNHIFRSTGKTTGKHQIAARRIRRHSSRTRSQRARRKSAAGWNRRNGKEDQRSTRAAASSRLADETQGGTASCRDGGGRRIQKVKIFFYSLLWFRKF